jgi:energy-coupling factor transport system ATP-binding protein
MNETGLMINAENISYTYPAHEGEAAQPPALERVDFKAYKGQFIAVLGRNGSGKSTLARHFNALLLPDSGTVWVKGMNTADEGLLWEIRRTAGMVFQNPDNQIVATVVEDDVAFGPENLGVPREEIRKRVDEALVAVHMEQHALKAPHMLSGGQKQRVAIAGVLALHPEVVVMDEPTAMLDPKGRRQVLQSIGHLRGEGITVILITHFMEEAVAADRVLVMDSGRIALQGTPQEVFSRRADLRAMGLDVPPIAELQGMLADDGVQLEGNLLTVEEMAGALWRLFSRM